MDNIFLKHDIWINIEVYLVDCKLANHWQQRERVILKIIQHL